MTVRFHPAARLELRETRIWYYARSPVAATAFAHEVAEAIGRIVEAPSQCAVGEHETRRFVLPRFPFSVIYRAGQSEVVIVAIAHQRRRPGYWFDR